MMRGDVPASVEMSREAMELLEVGSTPWFLSAAGVFSAGAFLGDPNVTAPVLQAIVTAPVEPEPSGPYGLAVYATCVGLNVMGQLELARSFLKRAEDIGRSVSEPDLVFATYLLATRGFLEVTDGKLGVALANSSESWNLADRAGDAFGRASAGMLIVQVLGQTGHWDRSEAAFRELRSFCEPRGLGFFSDWGALHLALAAVIARRLPEAIASLSTLVSRRDRLLAATARAYMAQALVHAGELDAAAREATTAIEGRLARTAASGALALVELRRGRAAEALAFAERGLGADSRAPWPSNGSMLRLARAEALHALGRADEAREAHSRGTSPAPSRRRDARRRPGPAGVLPHEHRRQRAHPRPGDGVAGRGGRPGLTDCPGAGPALRMLPASSPCAGRPRLTPTPGAVASLRAASRRFAPAGRRRPSRRAALARLRPHHGDRSRRRARE